MKPVELVGRRSSHFTRVAAIFAHELGVPFELVVLHELMSLDPQDYGGHPAMKIPALRVGDSVLFGTENICRRLAELAGQGDDPTLVWPQALTDDRARNAQELTWHAMSAQVQLVIGVAINHLPADNPFFLKLRRGLEGSLAWLDAQWPAVLASLPADRRASLLEVTLFCLVTHLVFRPTVPLDAYPNLRRFADEFSRRPSAQQTEYRFDPRRKETP